MSDLVFLGAGASRPFEIPTMKEMVTEFEKEVKSSEPKLFQYYTEIKDTLLKAFGNTNIDIEAILSVIEGISKDVKPQDLGHFASYYISKMGPAKQFSNEELESAKKLLEKLKEYIKNSCTVKLNENTEVYKNSYIPLFEILSGKKRQTFYDEFNLALDWKAYTTNYDLVFEGFWDNLARPIDHFDKPSDSDNYVFSNRLELDLHSFVKLHGSLDWTYNKKTRV